MIHIRIEIHSKGNAYTERYHSTNTTYSKSVISCYQIVLCITKIIIYEGHIFMNRKKGNYAYLVNSFSLKIYLYSH